MPATRSKVDTREPRSLADWLRAGTDDDLAALFRERPELLHPVPPDLAVLVARASERTSVQSALDRLDTWTLDVLAHLAGATSPLSVSDLARAIDADDDLVRPAVDLLRRSGLLWGSDDALHVIRTARESIGPPSEHARPLPPPLESVPGDADRAAHLAATHAATFAGSVEELLDTWAVDPPPVLRSGGLGVRELRRAASRLDRPDSEVALLVEIAHAARLLDSLRFEVWLPTTVYDEWREQSTAHRWLALATSWLTSMHVPGLVGMRDERGKTVTALSYELAHPAAARWRAAALDALTTLEPGESATTDSVVARLRWLAPRRGGNFRDEVVRWTLAEAEQLGMTGAGALSPHGRALLNGDHNDAVDALAKLLPGTVDYVLVQADLTAVAPGPLTRELARELALVAEVESSGAATVYRFTETSVRRALDAGRTATDLHDLLARHSRTPIPQPLTYLVDDLARRHGRIRVGTASAYIRCDDPAIVTELLSSRATAGLRLRRLAPNVVAAQAKPDDVLAVLRQLGHAPALESAAGDVVIRRPQERRAPAPSPRAVLTYAEPRVPSERVIKAAVRMLRAGDHAATVPRRPVKTQQPTSAVMPSTPQAQTLTALRSAASAGTPLWVGYVNAQGIASQRVVEPISVDGGYLRAYDHLRDEVRTFAVHRITGVAEVVDDE